MIDYLSKLEAVEAKIEAHKARRHELLRIPMDKRDDSQQAELTDYKEELDKLEEKQERWFKLVEDEQKASTSGKCWVPIKRVAS